MKAFMVSPFSNEQTTMGAVTPAARLARTFGVACACLIASGAASARELFSAGSVRLSLGGEGSISIAQKDHGYFNEFEYGHSSLRLFRARLVGEARWGDHVAALGEARQENTDSPRLYALYVRLRPWTRGPLDVQAGQVPPLFGAYPRRAYGDDHPLIGEPLGYQYLLSLRPDTAPASLDDLIRVRGRGWRVHYSGAATISSGLTPIQVQRWDTGVEARVSGARADFAAAVTQGSPSNPRVRDDNGGKCVTVRGTWRPGPGWVLGGSAASGRYLSRELEQDLGTRTQRALGADLAYSRGRLVVQTEAMRFSWAAPLPTPDDIDLPGFAALVEVRVKVWPGLSVAARADRLAFDRIPTSSGPQAWEYAVSRFEGGVAFTPRRHILLKAVYQYDRRAAGPNARQSFVAGQALLWF
jgi:hypothetical protein